MVTLSAHGSFPEIVAAAAAKRGSGHPRTGAIRGLPLAAAAAAAAKGLPPLSLGVRNPKFSLARAFGARLVVCFFCS